MEAALDELDGDHTAHLDDTVGAHGASAISIVDTVGGYAGASVEAALDEVSDRIGDGAASINFRNRLINGDMRIDQRYAGAAYSNNGTSTHVLDRWLSLGIAASAVFSTQRLSTGTPPATYTHYLRATLTTADATLSATDVYYIAQRIEGYNVADLAYGTANAKTCTLSFWVRCSQTGTFGGALNNSGSSRSYPFTYTISSANTWEQKTVTIAGDTAGTWLTTSGIGISVIFGLGMGSTYSGTAGAWAGANYASATGATNLMTRLNSTWDITGVQFEVGSVATPFERRPYGLEYALCERYCVRLADVMTPSGNQWGLKYNTQFIESNLRLPVTMASGPTLEGTAITSWNTGAPGATQASGFGAATGGYLSITGSLTVSIASTSVGVVLLRFTAGTSFSGTNGEAVVMFLGSGQDYRFVAEL